MEGGWFLAWLKIIRGIGGKGRVTLATVPKASLAEPQATEKQYSGKNGKHYDIDRKGNCPQLPKVRFFGDPWAVLLRVVRSPLIRIAVNRQERTRW